MALQRGSRFLVVASLLTFSEWAPAFPVRVSEAPENLLANTLQTIAGAKKSLRMNIYEMKSPEIAAAVVKKIEEGVAVHILMEGQPVGGMSDASKEIKDQIVAAMQSSAANAADRFSLMRADDSENADGKGRRFAFNHAKYMIADGLAVSVGSENFSSSDSVSKKKNRGWQVVAKDADMVDYYSKIFASDTKNSPDIVELVKESVFAKAVGLFRFAGTTPLAPRPNTFTPAMNGPDEFDAQSVQHVTSPQTSLAGLQQFISGAKRSLDLELMTFSPRWGSTGQDSPLLDEVIAAARRGIKIRVLLNDESVFGGGGNFEEATFADSKPSKNEETVEALNELAQAEGLKIEGRIADVKAMGVSYIHNKGAIADGSHVLVSSINWNQNSVERNREVAVILNSADIGRHYETLFDADWKASEPEVDAAGL